MNMSPALFLTYIKRTRGVTDKTLQHYITGLASINAILAKNNFRVSDVYSVQSFVDLDDIKAFLYSNEEFLIKDEIGHRMYSVAFKHFYRFAYKVLSSEN